MLTAKLTIILTIIHSTSFSEMLPILKKRVGVPPHEVLEEVIRTSHAKSLKTQSSPESAEREAPHLIWIVDPDPEMQTTSVYGDPQNKVMILRSRGCSMEGVLDELDYAILELHSPVLLFSTSTEGATLQRREEFLATVEQNIDEQVGMAVKRYNERIRNGRLWVLGSVYDTKNIYGRGHGRQIIININGETGADILRKMPITARMTPGDLDTGFGRK